MNTSQLRAALTACFALLIAALCPSVAKSTEILISGNFSTSNSTPDFDGSYTLTFDVNGSAGSIPVGSVSGTPLSVTNLTASVTFANGTQVTGSGDGSITPRVGGSSAFDYLQFDTGTIRGLFVLPLGYVGTGSVLLNDGLDSSIIFVGPHNANLYSGQSSIVTTGNTPEPASFSLLGAALLALGWYKRRSLKLGR